ncbi:hypothetical protein [Novosphingobium sp. PhB165]|uniref:hypothetical protein n=1 Tax=Novosphingobium sp. PhB165 TaxID=2485105 RepID=UPI00140546DC|nr:hypothetical protein [Novosphingobium sp. PhB165]
MEHEKDRYVGGRERRTILYTAVGIVGVFLFINDLVGQINGGGIILLMSGIRSANAQVPAIDIDIAGLRTVFMVGCAFVIASIGMALKADITKKGPQFIFIFSIIAGGFTADSTFDEPLIDRYMTARGYSHCALRDHEVGRGKGSVWFNSYVLNAAACSRVGSAR